MYWASLYSSYSQESEKGCEVVCIYNWLKNPCLRHQSIISVNLKAEGARKGSSLSSTHIPAIRLQHIFPPLNSGGGGFKDVAYYMFLKKSKLLLVSFRMISAKETSSGTLVADLKTLAVKLLQCK